MAVIPCLTSVLNGFFAIQFAIIPAMVYAEGQTVDLEKGRKLLGEQRIAAASAEYALVKVGTAAWSARVEDGIRYNFLARRYQDAWQLSQLAQRTDLVLSDIDYYLALSAVKAGVCPLAFMVKRPVFKALIYAHAYRFPQHFTNRSGEIDPYEDAAVGISTSLLQSNRIFYLHELLRAKLIKGAGCAFAVSSFGDDTLRTEREFQHLRTWLKIIEGPQSVTVDPESFDSDEDEILPSNLPGSIGEDEVKLRLLELAAKRNQEDLVKHLLEPFSRYTEVQWA